MRPQPSLLELELPPLPSLPALLASSPHGRGLNGRGYRTSSGGAPANAWLTGFKELVVAPARYATGKGGKFAHLLGESGASWLPFLERLFPCSKVVFNIRRNTTAQALSMIAAFEGERASDVAQLSAQLEKERDALGGVGVQIEDERRLVLEQRCAAAALALGRAFGGDAARPPLGLVPPHAHRVHLALTAVARQVAREGDIGWEGARARVGRPRTAAARS